MKRIFIMLLVLFTVLMLTMGCTTTSKALEDATNSTIEVTTEPTLSPLEYGLLDYNYIEFNDSSSAWYEYVSVSEYLYDLRVQRMMLDTTHPDYSKVNCILTDEILRIEELEIKYFEDYNRLLEIETENNKWVARMDEYPVATTVWLFLKEEMDYSNEACAGIIGNMMAECGGHTLELEWWLYNSTSHYGLCQWSAVYYPVMQGASLEEQLEYMLTSFPRVINEYGYLYRTGFTHDDYATMTDAGDAAYAFCIIYEERPGGNQNYRRSLAEQALIYFTS